MGPYDDISWNQTIRKEARALGGATLGEVREVSDKYVITEKGLVNKDRFYIPKKSVMHVDGQYVWIRMTEDEAKQYKID